MENIRNMFKWSILIAVLFLMPQVSHAEENKVNSDRCLSPIYDLTGTYDDFSMLDCEFPLTVVQDGKGKISGEGDSNCTTNIVISEGDIDYNREVYLDFHYVAKGAVKSTRQLSLSVKMKGTAYGEDLEGTPFSAPFSATQTVKAQIEEGPVMYGSGKAKGCIKKIGCNSERFQVVGDPLGDPENGTWTLTFDEDTSMGELELFNGRTFPFAVKGKQNLQKGESTFSLKGIDTSLIETSAKGCKLKGKFNDDNKLMSLKGKVLGQKIDCQ